MSTIQLSARFKIHKGQLQAFKALGKPCMEVVKEKDTGTRQYDWFFSENETECVVRETYIDSDALLAHVGNLGELFGQLLALSDFNLEIYGAPSEALVEATKPFSVSFYTFFQGM